ncbi:MAG: phosphate acyltransferase PlsX [Chloroflexia bacterium]|nr:phosphate acyltransferase PlsX [Chloroflexia bacterium]
MTTRIAVDAMGGDHGPAVIVTGAVAGARSLGCDLLLVGQPEAIREAMVSTAASGVHVDIVDAEDVIGMDEHAAQAVRRKPRSSIVVALRLIKDGRADAVVSAGNSGAVMAAALMVLGRIPGIDRPAIASSMPTAASRTLLLDLGAVADPRPANLVQFAVMGQVYAEKVLGVANPSVGLLSNGEEATKGNALVQQVHALLVTTEGLNFVGNVEGSDIARGTIDVVVTDGFTGNVALKTAEGIATLMTELLRAEITSTLPRKLAGLLLRPAFRAVRDKLDYAETGGAALLGVNGAVIIAHGRSSARAIENALRVAAEAAEHDLTAKIAERVKA